MNTDWTIGIHALADDGVLAGHPPAPMLRQTWTKTMEELCRHQAAQPDQEQAHASSQGANQ